MDIVFAYDEDPFVYVTGTSFDTVTDNDIATLKIEGGDGDLSSSWQAGSGSAGNVIAGERRFDLDGGPDSAAQMQWATITDTEGGITPGNWIFVAGTSYEGSGNAANNDIVVLAYDGDAVWNGDEEVIWYQQHDGGDEDVATGLAGFAIGGSLAGGGVFVSGYSVWTTVDYVTAGYALATGDPLWDDPPTIPPHRYWNGPGNGTDIAAANAAGAIDSVPLPLIWVTGQSANGGTFDAGTVIYDAFTGDQLCSGVVGVANGSSETPVSITAEDGDATAYVTGSTVVNSIVRAHLFKLTLVESSGTYTCGSNWQIQYPLTGSRSPSGGNHVLLPPGGIGVFVAGHTDVATYATDALTVRYTD